MKNLPNQNDYLNYWDEKVEKEGEYPEYLTPGGRHHVFASIMNILEHLPRNKKVLDIGCGTAFTTYFYYPFCKELTAIDYAKEPIKKANSKYPHIRFVESTVSNMPFEDNEFDVVICQGVLHHLIKDTITNKSSTKYIYNAIGEIDRVGNGLILVDEANALNPLRKYKEQTYYKKIKRDEHSLRLKEWTDIFNELNFGITYYHYHTFTPVGFSREMIKIFRPVESMLEITPILKRFAGGIFFKCEK